MWRDDETGEVAKTHSDVRMMRPMMTLPVSLTDGIIEDIGFSPVLPVAPEYNAITHSASEIAPELVGGVWQQAWEIVALPQAEADTNLANAKAKAWEAIKAERDRRQHGGVLVSGKWFHSDDASRIQQISLVMLGAGIPANLQWKTMDGTFTLMTPELASQIFNSSVAQDQAIFGKAEEHRMAMEQTTSPADYDFMTGWPAVYEA